MEFMKFLGRYIRIICKTYSFKGSLLIGSILPFGAFALWFTHAGMNKIGNTTNSDNLQMMHDSGLIDWMNRFYGMFGDLIKELFGFTEPLTILIFMCFFVGSFWYLCWCHFMFLLFESSFQILKRRKFGTDEYIQDYLDWRIWKERKEEF